MPQTHRAASPLNIAADYEYLTLDVAALAQQAKLKRYGYRVGNLGLLVPANTLSEVLRQFVIYPLPNVQPWFRGLVNLRGNVVPVYELGQLLGYESSAESLEHLLILDKGADAVGILVARLPVACEVETWEKAEAVGNIPASLADHVTEAYVNNEALWISFDHKAFFSSLKNNVAL
jgi:chemotaxis signal transduction protein